MKDEDLERKSRKCLKIGPGGLTKINGSHRGFCLFVFKHKAAKVKEEHALKLKTDRKKLLQLIYTYSVLHSSFTFKGNGTITTAK